MIEVASNSIIIFLKQNYT